MQKKHYTDILWDFNGTILDDVQVGIDSVNKLLAERELPLLSGVEAYHKVFGFPIIDYYRRLGFDFEKENFETIAPIWVSEYLSRSRDAGLRDGVRELLFYFESLGLRQTIISATEENMLRGQIDALGIGGFFKELYGLDNIHAGSKERRAADWRLCNPDAVALFIGDTVHDAETADAVGADCLLVSGGHQSRETLLGCGYPVTDSFSQIRTLFEQKHK